jgi:hypothetical protein
MESCLRRRGATPALRGARIAAVLFGRARLAVCSVRAVRAGIADPCRVAGPSVRAISQLPGRVPNDLKTLDRGRLQPGIYSFRM